MNKGKRDTKDDERGDKKRMKIGSKKLIAETKASLRSKFKERVFGERFGGMYWFGHCYWFEGETYLHFAAFLGDDDATKSLIQEDDVEMNAVNNNKHTAIHFAAKYGHVDVAKVLLQNGADVNAGDKYKRTALYWAAQYGRTYCTLQLLCFGAEIDEKAIKDDKTKLLRPIESRLELLRNGNRIGTSLMSDEERRFMWNLALVLAIKHPAIAFRTHQRIRSFVTFHGIFMGPGYDLGDGSIWKRTSNN